MDKRTNVNKLIGKKALVQKGISEFMPGTVKVGYEEWRAESADRSPIAAGTTVLITGIEGVTLKVKKEVGQ